MPEIWLFSFFGLIAGFFPSHSPQIDANLHISGLLSQKKGSQLISLPSLYLVLAYLFDAYLMVQKELSAESPRLVVVKVSWSQNRISPDSMGFSS